MELEGYHTIASECQGEHRDRKSKFLSYAFPITSEEDFKQTLSRLRGVHKQANHHCYGFRLGMDGSVERCSDDGEPNGTSGAPILSRIKHHGLTNTAVVVVRYFGGIKLGKGGLARAYGTSAEEALMKCETVFMPNMTEGSLRTTIGQGEKIKEQIIRSGGTVLEQDYSEGLFLKFSLPVSLVERLNTYCSERGIEPKFHS